MRYILVSLAFFSIAFAVLVMSLAFYPFLEMGLNSLTNQYPNSKAYILSVMTNDTGDPLGFYIVGIDFTTANSIIVDVPKELNVKGTSLSVLYTNDGIKYVENALSNIMRLKFTDYLVFTSSKAEKFEKKLRIGIPLQEERIHKIGYSKTSESEKVLQIERLVEEFKNHDMFRTLSLYPAFSENFKSTIKIPKFLRIAKFFGSEPRISVISYPFMNSDGTLKTDKTELKNLFIELENCTPIHQLTSIKVTFINNSYLTGRVFSYGVWNKWSKKGYDFRIIPVICSYDYFYKNAVLEISNVDWKISEIKKALKSVYPNRDFAFLSLDDRKNLKLYYQIEEQAAMNRYYNIGNSDFIVLVGR